VVTWWKEKNERLGLTLSRFKACKLPTLYYRHIRGHMTEMDKILLENTLQL